MKVKTIEPMIVSQEEGAPINAFRQDSYNMGTNIGRNVTIMYDAHDDDTTEYIIIVNRMTGERIKVEF